MSSPERTPARATARRRALRLLAAAACGGLAGACGFRPLYGEQDGAAGSLRGEVAVSGADGRLGFHFRDRLRRRLDDPRPDAAFTLEVALSLRDEGLAITRQDDVTRISLFGEARWRLARGRDGAEMAAGAVTSSSGYSTLASPYATRIARRDAERRVAEDLAERVFARLAALPQAPAKTPPAA